MGGNSHLIFDPVWALGVAKAWGRAMIKLLAALLTGVFCASLAFVVDIITDALAAWQVVAIAAVSGFCGSLFGNTVLGLWK